jgi:hypothetical protein
VGKHYDRSIDELNGLIGLAENTQTPTSSDRMQLALATLTSVLCDIDVNLAAIADALEEKKDDKA